MTVHLLKLCVGVESPADLERRQRVRIRESAPAEAWHPTRRWPRRAAEIRDGGSLYWVMNGAVRARQRITDLREGRDSHGNAACILVLAPEVVRVVSRPQRPFQGWRYLEADAAPRDSGSDCGDEAAMPSAILAELAERGFR